MVFKNVVVAYDGSDHALAAVTKAAELVKDDAGAKLHLVFVTTHPNAQLPANLTVLHLILSSICFPLRTL